MWIYIYLEVLFLSESLSLLRGHYFAVHRSHNIHINYRSDKKFWVKIINLSSGRNRHCNFKNGFFLLNLVNYSPSLRRRRQSLSSPSSLLSPLCRVPPVCPASEPGPLLPLLTITQVTSLSERDCSAPGPVARPLHYILTLSLSLRSRLWPRNSEPIDSDTSLTTASISFPVTVKLMVLPAWVILIILSES